jgi:hypothetical protein
LKPNLDRLDFGQVGAMRYRLLPYVLRGLWIASLRSQ